MENESAQPYSDSGANAAQAEPNSGAGISGTAATLAVVTSAETSQFPTLSSLLGHTDKGASPWLSLIFSTMIYPGAGQIMNRRLSKAIAFSLSFTVLMGIAVYYIFNGTMEILVPEFKSHSTVVSAPSNPFGISDNFFHALIWSALGLACYIWAAVDAVRESRRLRASRH